MDFKFEDAEPIIATPSGRVAEPNPFITIIGEIAMKVKDGKPVAKSFTAPTGTVDKDGKKDAEADSLAKTLRQLGEAGALVTPQVTVRKVITPAVYKNGNPIPNVSKVTFWTVERIVKPRKVATPDATPEPTPDTTSVVAE